jgi:hypothetical protein
VTAVFGAAAQVAAAVEGPTSAGQGVVGFLVIFFLALATFFLIRSMTGHLRKVRYSPDPAADPDGEPGDTPDGRGGPGDRPGDRPGDPGTGRRDG